MTTLAESLAALGLRHAAAHLDDLVATATTGVRGAPRQWRPGRR